MRDIRRIQILLVVVGLVVAAYLSYLKLTDLAAVCVEAAAFDCNVVLNSRYSELAGIPIAYLGFGVYAIIGALLLMETRVVFLRENGSLLMFGLGLFAWLFSMWLVYVQVVLLQALCPWCLAHELNFTILFGTIVYRVLRTL
ncbi:MAG: vitamin K epoxide reductase family protein [Chloroflexi bacterium]|nr:vitamin K epoxide reductase family protein [Chloroflexota bacterium]MCY4246936.1 vitamin K epoxide reductase family protein [Chloroflexota bacterium]